MLRLVLLRHSKTVPTVPAGDHARHLTPRGLSDAMGVGLRLASMARPDFALVSDARRTRETFDQVIATAGRSIQHRFEPRLYGASAEEIMKLVAQTPDTVETLLVIGHNPGLGDVARRLSHGAPAAMRRDMDLHFPTSALAVIGLDASDWTHPIKGGTLEAFHTPHHG